MFSSRDRVWPDEQPEAREPDGDRAGLLELFAARLQLLRDDVRELAIPFLGSAPRHFEDFLDLRRAAVEVRLDPGGVGFVGLKTEDDVIVFDLADDRIDVRVRRGSVFEEFRFAGEGDRDPKVAPLHDVRTAAGDDRAHRIVADVDVHLLGFELHGLLAMEDRHVEAKLVTTRSGLHRRHR